MNSYQGKKQGDKQAGTKIAEVVESSSASVKCQCHDLYDGVPSLGSFLRVGEPREPAVYAVVYNVVTGALDPGRRVMARGAGEESEAAVYRGNPQLSKLLATHLEAHIVGYLDGEIARHGLPPVPPHIHAFVYPCGPAEVATFTQQFDFLHLLVDSSKPGADEVIAACLRGAAACHQDTEAFRVAAGRALALELAGDIGRLNAILRRLAL